MKATLQCNPPNQRKQTMSTLLDLIKAKKSEIAQATGDYKKTIKPVDGTSRYRILPAWKKGSEQFWHDFGQHFIKKDGKILSVMNCDNKTHGKNCAVCNAIEQGIRSSTDDEMIEALTAAKSKGRYLVNAVEVARNPGQVEILELPSTAFNALLEAVQTNEEEAGLNILSVREGKDILIKREGTGLKTKYTVSVSPKGTPLPADIMDKVNDLDDYVGVSSSTVLNRALSAVQAVLGRSGGEHELLPAPKKSSSKFAVIEEDEGHPWEEPKKKAEVTDVKVKEKTPEKSDVSEDDLDSILAGLEDYSTFCKQTKLSWLCLLCLQCLLCKLAMLTFL